MTITEERDGEVLIMAVGPRLDATSSTDFEHRLLHLIDAGQRSFLVDCRGLEYINSAGLKAFLLAAKKLEPLGGRLVLCGLTSNVQMVFELTGFHLLFTITATVLEARAALQ